MEKAQARRLFEEGGFLILLDVPEGTEFGIDLKSWNTGQKFRGVKMIPPGLHYIFYSSVGQFGDTAPRCGFFHYFKKGEVFVRKWDKTMESMSFDIVPEATIVGLKENIRALDQFLGPYPYSIWEKWKKLSANITDNLVRKLMPLSGEVRSALELEPCTDANRPRGKKVCEKEVSYDAGGSVPKKSRSSFSDDEFLPDLKAKEGTSLRFTEFPILSYPPGSTPSEITQHSLDSTYLFEQVLSNYDEPTDILGELEFCYACFLIGHSLEAFEQWKKIFCLFCSCDAGVKKHRRLYDSFLSTVQVQIQETPEDFLADIVDNNNFVYIKLRQLFRSIIESDVDDKLKCKADRLRKSLTSLYQWDFRHLQSEDDDEAPVVVKLDSY